MMKMDGMASLNLVKQEVDATLKQIESHLRVFLENQEDTERLIQGQALLHQLRGVFTLINLAGAEVLVSDMEMAITQLMEGVQTANREARLLSLGHGLLVLSHYIEFVYCKQRSVPVLLVPAINELRCQLGLSLVSEFDFSEVDIPVRQLEDTPLVDAVEVVDLNEIPRRARRLRQLFQVGLLGVVRNESVDTNIKMMTRSVERFARLTGDVPLAQLWWVSLAVLESFSIGAVQLTTARKIVLSRIDREMKRLVSEGASYLNELMPLDLLRECLYLVTLSNSDGQYTQDVKHSFGLSGIGMTDAELQEQRKLMNGPGGTIIGTVVGNMLEEITSIKDTLDSGARGIFVDQASIQELADTLSRISSTMAMLGMLEASTHLREQVQEIRIWITDAQPLSDEAFRKVADAVLYTEQSLSILVNKYNRSNVSQTVEPEADTLRLPASESGGVALNLLDEAYAVVVTQARIALSQATKKITLYLDSKMDKIHVQTVPDVLHDVVGALNFLCLSRAANIVAACKAFIQQRIVYGAAGELPSNFDLETLADALTSVDYYLEGLEVQKPIGLGILEVAEESIAELGFAVSQVA
ncbi:MAG: hypothetical protein P8144_10975 [Gammaproteobacteria bacterium]